VVQRLVHCTSHLKTQTKRKLPRISKSWRMHPRLKKAQQQANSPASNLHDNPHHRPVIWEPSLSGSRQRSAQHRSERHIGGRGREGREGGEVGGEGAGRGGRGARACVRACRLSCPLLPGVNMHFCANAFFVVNLREPRADSRRSGAGFAPGPQALPMPATYQIV
jgi:hypothetical protein